MTPYDPTDPRLRTNPFLVPAQQVPLGAGALPLARATTDTSIPTAGQGRRAFQPPAQTFTPSIPTAPLARADTATATAAPSPVTAGPARTLDSGAAPAAPSPAPAGSSPLARADFVPTPEQLPFTLPARPQARVLSANEQRLADAQARGSGISNIRNPFLKTLARVGDIALGTFLPAAEMLTPGTTGNYGLTLRGLQRAVTSEQEGAASEARSDLERAQARHFNVEAQNLENPPALKPRPEDLQRTLVTDQGIMQWNPATNRFDIPAGQAPAKEEVEGKTVTTDQGIMQWDPRTKTYSIKVGNAPAKETAEKTLQDADGVWYHIGNDNVATPITVNGQPFKGRTPDEKSDTEIIHKQVGGKPHNVMVKKGTGEVVADLGEIGEKLSTADHGVTMIGPDGRVLRLEPGQTAPQGFLTPTQAGAQNAPTTQMRNVGAQAQLVHEQTPQMLAELDRLKGKVGAVSGRWNEFMQGKVGLDDPDMAGLRTDLLMYSSAVALMHARGRLPENLREEFDRAINSPKQSADNLKTVIQHVDAWTAANMQQMGGRGGAAATGAGAGGPAATGAPPKQGDKRTYNGRSYEFNGTKWVGQ